MLEKSLLRQLDEFDWDLAPSVEQSQETPEPKLESEEADNVNAGPEHEEQ